MALLKLASVLALVLLSSPGDDREGRTEAVEKTEEPDCPVTLRLRTAKTCYRRLEPIVVECEIANHSDEHDFNYFFPYGPYFDATSQDLILHLEVTGREGKVPVTRFGQYHRGYSGSHRALTAGAKSTRHFTINAFFDMTEDGEYLITATMPIEGLGNRPLAGFLVKSRPIRVKVEGDAVATKEEQAPLDCRIVPVGKDKQRAWLAKTWRFAGRPWLVFLALRNPLFTDAIQIRVKNTSGHDFHGWPGQPRCPGGEAARGGRGSVPDWSGLLNNLLMLHDPDAWWRLGHPRWLDRGMIG